MNDFYSSGFSVMGDLDRTAFHFNEQLTPDELTELLERNPTISMQCDWIPGEAIKNGFIWDDLTYNPETGEIEGQDDTEEGSYSTGETSEEMLLYEDPVTGEDYELSRDDFLEVTKMMEKIHRAMMFAELHGTSLIRLYPPNKAGIKQKVEVYHRGYNHSGWQILKHNVDEQGQVISVHIRIMPSLDEPNASEKVAKPLEEYDIPVSEIVFFHAPKKGERWGGTPRSKLVAHVALAEELLLKLMLKHALDIVNTFMHFKGVQSQQEADALHEQYSKIPLTELFTKNVELEPMRNEIQGSAADFDLMFSAIKDYIARGLRVSRQAMDGAPEGTQSSAQYNTQISYAYIEQIQNHYKPYIEELFRRIGIKNWQFSWMLPMMEGEQGAQDKPGEGQGSDMNDGE